MHLLPSSDAKQQKPCQMPRTPVSQIVIKKNRLLFIATHLVTARAITEAAVTTLVGVILSNLGDINGDRVELGNIISKSDRCF